MEDSTSTIDNDYDSETNQTNENQDGDASFKGEDSTADESTTMEMSNSKLLKPFESLCRIQNRLEEQSGYELEEFIRYARHCAQNNIEGQIATVQMKNDRMRKELESAVKRQKQLENNVSSASSMLEEESSKTQRAQLLRDNMKQELDRKLKQLMESRDIPQYMKDIVREKISALERQATNDLSYEEDPSVIACSRLEEISNDTTLDAMANSSATFVNSNSNDVVFAEIWGSITGRQHDYKSEVIMKPTRCIVCDSRLELFRHARKCISCKANVHEKCRDRLPKPCIPTPVTKSDSSNLEDLCPPAPYRPMIPAIIFHSASYIETNGLNLSGLYSSNVCDSDVKRLSEMFHKNKGVPNLNNFNARVVAAFLKKFLASLNPPLITEAFLQTMLKKEREENFSYDDVMEDTVVFPNQNRDTLAFLILHFQKVANSQDCCMNSEMLAEIFSPILLKNQKCKTLRKLIDTPKETWQRVLCNSCTF